MKKKLAQKRGFAALSAKERKEIAQLGGKAVSKDRDHMAEIGKRGGQLVSKDREYMAALGRKGGKARAKKKKEEDP